MEFVFAQGEPVCDAVINAVSESESRSPASLPSLYDTIDPDALESLCARRSAGTLRSECKVSFLYSDSHVVVDTAELTITVSPATHAVG